MSRRRSLQIASWNIENLAPYLTDQRHGSLPDLLARFGHPDILCLQEIRIRPLDAGLIAAMEAALPGYRCHAALNRDARNAGYRGGRAYGVATWSRDALAGTGHALPWDLEGRAVVTLLPTLRWAVFNIYAVNGTAKPYWSHEHGAFAGDRHAFKRRFIERLGEAGKALQAEGFELVMIGDWNVSRTRADTCPRLRTEQPHALARTEFNEQFMPGLGLVDAFGELHPDERRYTWFNRRARGGRLDAARVDFALVGASLLPELVEADIEPATSVYPGSDHVPLWLRLRMPEAV